MLTGPEAETQQKLTTVHRTQKPSELLGSRQHTGTRTDTSFAGWQPWVEKEWRAALVRQKAASCPSDSQQVRQGQPPPACHCVKTTITSKPLKSEIEGRAVALPYTLNPVTEVTG